MDVRWHWWMIPLVPLFVAGVMIGVIVVGALWIVEYSGVMQV